jgi:formylmethanofuran dehydrogenase subunit E
MTVVCKTCNEKRAHRDALSYDDYSICDVCLTYYENKHGKKSSKSLKKCDVFTIRLSNLKKYHYALVEWGRAKEMGKVLVVVMDETSSEFSQKFLSYLAKESKESFKKHSKEMRNCIIKKNEALSVNSYSEYKKSLTEFKTK